MRIEVATLRSPIGPLLIGVSGARLLRLELGGDALRLRQDLVRRFDDAAFEESRDPSGIVSCLARYFAGELGAIETVPVDPGGTPFQHQVWLTLRRIPAGRTWTYAELARAVGRPAAVRAVGAANGANPIALVLPCHRVIGSDGRLTGYGGGLDRKEWLLRHEGASFVPEPSLPLLKAMER